MFAATRTRDIGGSRKGLGSFRSQISGSLSLVERLERINTLEGHLGCVNTVSFSDCGDLLISGSDDKRIIIWNWHTGKAHLSSVIHISMPGAHMIEELHSPTCIYICKAAWQSYAKRFLSDLQGAKSSLTEVVTTTTYSKRASSPTPTTIQL